MERTLNYALEHGYTKYASPNVNNWRESISGITEALAQAAAHYNGKLPEFSPEDDQRESPITEFGRVEAHKHLTRGIALPTFLGLLKYYRQAYLDLIERHFFDEEAAHANAFVTRCFDLFAIGLTAEWTNYDEPEHIASLRGKNKYLTNEINKYITLFESVSDPILLIDDTGHIGNLNLAAAKFLRLKTSNNEPADPPQLLVPANTSSTPRDRASVIGLQLGAVIPWLEDEVLNFWAGGKKNLRTEKSIQHFENTRHVSISIASMLDVSGKFNGAVITFVDTTQQMETKQQLLQQERELIRSMDMLKRIMDGTPAFISFVDTDLRYQFVNKYYEELYSIPAESVIGKRVPDLIGKETYEKVRSNYQMALSGQETSIEVDYQSPHKGLRRLSAHYLPHIYNGAVEGIILLILDQTESYKANRERDRFFTLSLDMMCITDFKGRFRHANPACIRFLGWTEQELKNNTWHNLFHEEDLQRLGDAVTRLNANQIVKSFETRLKHKDGTYRWISFNALPLREEDTIYVVARDITERKQMVDELKHFATVDFLTGADNRRHFMNQGEHEFLRAKRYHHPLSVIMLDIDHFKLINDDHGHAAGDVVLKALAECCRATLRETDIFGRIGGEEFAIVLLETELDHATQTAERLRTALGQELVSTTSGTIRFTVSIGVATMSQPDGNISELLNRADVALYKAKQQGRNRVIVAD